MDDFMPKGIQNYLQPVELYVLIRSTHSHSQTTHRDRSRRSQWAPKSFYLFIILFYLVDLKWICINVDENIF